MFLHVQIVQLFKATFELLLSCCVVVVVVIYISDIIWIYVINHVWPAYPSVHFAW